MIKMESISLFKSGPVTSNGVDCCSFLNPDDLKDQNN